MPPFPKPKQLFPYSLPAEIAALRAHRTVRGVPAKAAGELLIATWNIANLGWHKREDDDLALIAEMLGWFDVIAVQEVVSDFSHLVYIVHEMGPQYRYLMSDAAGNNERMVFIYDSTKVTLLEEVGEIAYPPSQLRHVKLKSAPKAKFTAFDRNPYLASFQLSPQLSVQLVNVHLFFGGETPTHVQRRALETAAVARWCDLRSKSDFSGAREIIALGDFNMPKAKADGGNVVYDALTNRGLILPAHSTEIASMIASDNLYDQIAIYQSTTQGFTIDTGIFDFDGVVFAGLWNSTTKAKFLAYVRYYLSDHRPMWIRLR